MKCSKDNLASVFWLDNQTIYVPAFGCQSAYRSELTSSNGFSRERSGANPCQPNRAESLWKTHAERAGRVGCCRDSLVARFQVSNATTNRAARSKVIAAFEVGQALWLAHRVRLQSDDG
tara:strand:+ start:779 stop:1135 length:357 start_codon:yes stop_codon:yes gene_type:complete